jgi:hypothetical protein
MSNMCSACGYTKSQAIADARTLGLQRELQRGIYTCCQIAEWADEQWLAWLEAAEQDGKPCDDVAKLLELDEAKAPLVPIRLPRPEVPWYRKPDDLI